MVVDAVANSLRRCYPRLLQSATAAATHGLRGCYERRSLLLRTAAAVAEVATPYSLDEGHKIRVTDGEAMSASMPLRVRGPEARLVELNVSINEGTMAGGEVEGARRTRAAEPELGVGAEEGATAARGRKSGEPTGPRR
jgi:hypothetical protein